MASSGFQRKSPFGHLSHAARAKKKKKKAGENAHKKRA
jgi:hypothetical protein